MYLLLKDLFTQKKTGTRHRSWEESLSDSQSSWALAWRMSSPRTRSALEFLFENKIVTSNELEGTPGNVSEHHMQQCIDIAKVLVAEHETTQCWDPEQARQAFRERLVAKLPEAPSIEEVEAMLHQKEPQGQVEPYEPSRGAQPHGTMVVSSKNEAHLDELEGEKWFQPDEGTPCNIATRTWKEMSCAGFDHTVLLRSDGRAIACGSNAAGQCSIPVLEDGVTYSQVSAGWYHTILLRSDGQAVACGWNAFGECTIPELADGLTYSQVSAGYRYTVLLRSDGRVVACGKNDHGQCNIPDIEDTVTYSQVSAGWYHTVLLRSDGRAVACGGNAFGQCNIPNLEDGLTYFQVSAGVGHTVLLRSDGRAVVACGWNAVDQYTIPDIEDGITYSQISAGNRHTILLRSDGCAVACGRNTYGQCEIPDLDDGVVYSHVSAGYSHTILLRSDGRSVACGNNAHGQCNIPSLRTWKETLTLSQATTLKYVPDRCARNIHHVLQLSCSQAGNEHVRFTCLALNGEEVCAVMIHEDDPLTSLQGRIAKLVLINEQELRLVLPDGMLLSSTSASRRVKDCAWYVNYDETSDNVMEIFEGID